MSVQARLQEALSTSRNDVEAALLQSAEKFNGCVKFTIPRNNGDLNRMVSEISAEYGITVNNAEVEKELAVMNVQKKNAIGSPESPQSAIEISSPLL